ncbi:hypothetical protein J5277_29465 [Rhizobium sp. 16-449-1b]|uniref:hypothetical protein n=1 Tax=Rhizobium sp. 16-449-1b TaxID=2819989 RepID=UPI001ADCD5AA|nr:hypothetical protein [Rhizobium sp. 16-449-1b]MBO9198263.1 hypothetical protein [Rhizobium sp. 16-449-1b]
MPGKNDARKTDSDRRPISSGTQFANGGNPKSRHAPKQFEVPADPAEIDDLSLMMIQAREGRA